MTLQLPPRLPEAQAEIARALAAAHKADVAEAMSRMDPAAAAEVLSAFRAAPRSLSSLRDRHGRDLHSGHVARPTGPPPPGATTSRPHPLPGRTGRGDTRHTRAAAGVCPNDRSRHHDHRLRQHSPDLDGGGDAEPRRPGRPSEALCTRSMFSTPTTITSSTSCHCGTLWSRIRPRGSWTSASTADSSR
jgi:hypothetical protein